MPRFRADLHIHTVLSPCGDLEMSPSRIVAEARGKGLDILGITDHNSTRHVALISQLAAREGIFVLGGAEVTTKEETHCLAFFENLPILAEFQQYLEQHLPPVKNDPARFGYQVVVDEQEQILDEVDYLLISALNQSIDQVEQKVHALGGLFIPAHIDRPSYSLTSQLGFVPPDLKADAFEVSRFSSEEIMLAQFPWLKGKAFLKSSDAHRPEQIGSRYTDFEMESACFHEIHLALKAADGRNIVRG